MYTYISPEPVSQAVNWKVSHTHSLALAMKSKGREFESH